MRFELPDWPHFGLAEDVRPALRAARAAANPSVLVTLFSVEGGGPRPEGAQMLFADGLTAGFLSGGCVEGDVAIHAARTLEDGEARLLVYGEGGPWPDIRLLCGARIELLVERIAPDDPAAGGLLAAMDARRPVVWRTDGERRSVVAARPGLPDCAISQAPFTVERLYEPVLRVVVVGGDPTALATAQLAALSGYETTLVRPKGPGAPPALAGVAYHRGEPEAALAEIGVDPWTAIAVATHDWDVDQAALEFALASPAAYVGVLGARRRLPERLARLRAAGVDEAQIGRLHAPIGLALGGKAPWEVAVAIVAEMVAGRHAARAAEPQA